MRFFAIHGILKLTDSQLVWSLGSRATHTYTLDRMPPSRRAWAHATHARHLCPASHARHLCPASARSYLVKTEVSNDGRHLCPCWLLEISRYTGTRELLFLDLWRAKVNLSHVVHLRLCWRDPGKGAAGRNAPWVCLRPMLLCHLGWGNTLQKSMPAVEGLVQISNPHWKSESGGLASPPPTSRKGAKIGSPPNKTSMDTKSTSQTASNSFGHWNILILHSLMFGRGRGNYPIHFSRGRLNNSVHLSAGCMFRL